jgi:hypothetical protein
MSVLFEAIKKQIEGEVAIYEAELRIYAAYPVGVGDHATVIPTMKELVHKLSEARDNLITINTLIDMSKADPAESNGYH